MNNTNKVFIEFYSLYVLAVASLVVLAIQDYHSLPNIWGLILIYCVGTCFLAVLIWLFRMGLECIRCKQKGLAGPA